MEYLSKNFKAKFINKKNDFNHLGDVFKTLFLYAKVKYVVKGT